MVIEYRGAGCLGSRLSYIKYLGIIVALLCQVPTNNYVCMILYPIFNVSITKLESLPSQTAVAQIPL